MIKNLTYLCFKLDSEHIDTAPDELIFAQALLRNINLKPIGLYFHQT